jgi:hypothetical protein
MSFPAPLASYRMTALVAFAVCVTLCACALFLLVTWSEPVADDFCRASFFAESAYIGPPFSHWPGPPFFQRPGVFQYTGLTYLNWSGRWAGVGFMTFLLSTATLPASYPWLVFVLIATECLLLYFAIREFVVDARHALELSAVIALVYWATMPTLQGIFWIPGAVEDQLPLALGSLLFALVLSPRRTATKQSRRLATIAASVLGFVTPAFHEVAGAVLVLALSAITATAFWSKGSRRKEWLVVWTASAMGFLVVYAAPGNFVRAAIDLPAFPYRGYRGNYLVTVKWSLWTIRSYVLPWCLDFKHWLLAVLLWFDPRVASLRNKLSGLSSFGAIGGFVTVWISSIMIAIGATIWNVGGMPPGRTMNLIYGVFLAGWIAVAFLVVRPHPDFSVHPVRRAATLSTALLLLSALVATSNNTVQSIGDIVRGSARSWNAEMNRSFVLLKSAGRNSNLVLRPPSGSFNGSLGNGIKEDPDYFANRCLSQYFGVASVRNSATISK